MRFLAASLGTVVALLAVASVYQKEKGRQQKSADKTLQNMQARISGVIESAMDAIITVDEAQRIVLFNAAAEKVFRWPRDAALGRHLNMLIPQRMRPTHPAHIERFGATGVTSRRMGDKTVLVGLRADGEEFPLEASISQHTENNQKLFTVILRDVTERVQSVEALRRSKDELRELWSAAHSAREQEKSRIARELHDELAQSLTFLKMDLTGIRDRLPAEQGALSGKLDGTLTELDAMVKATRRIAADLRPLMLDDLGLVPAAEWLVENFMERHGIHCEFSVDPPELELQEPHATALFRILQESLVNVARHARATLVHVTLDGSGGEVVLRVRDNGRGFDAGSPRERSSLGLLGLRERASLLSGELGIETAPGRGTVIEVRMPLPETA